MSELLFVTVGTTAIRNEKIGDGDLTDIARQYLSKPKREKAAFARIHNLERKLVWAHANFWKEMEEGSPTSDDFDRTSAELTSTRALLRQFPSLTTVVFLGSNTEEGELATNINHAVLEQTWNRGHVLKKIIPGLEKSFTRVTPALKQILEHYQAHEAHRVSFNVTGGFKGVIPSVTYLATLHPGWAIYYQYQDQNTVAEVFFSERPGAPLAMKEEEVKPGPVCDPKSVRG